MSDRLSGFRSPEAEARYADLYDRFIERHWPSPREELDVATRFGPTHVRRTGTASGTPLVVIHPTSGSSIGLYPLIAHLASEHTVFTPDTVGTIGRSVQTAPIRSASDLSAWLDDVLDQLAIDTAHLVGYSEGGWVAGMHAAATARRDRLASLTLIEPGGAIERIPPLTLANLVGRGARTLLARDKPAAIRRFSRWMNGDVELSDDEVDLVLLSFRSFRQRLPLPGRLDDAALRRMTTPTLLLLGAESRIYDVDRVAARARSLLPDVAVEVMAGAGHGLPFQFPDAVTHRILDFIAHHEPRTAPT